MPSDHRNARRPHRAWSSILTVMLGVGWLNATVAWGQVLDQVPANALAVFVVRRLDMTYPPAAGTAPAGIAGRATTAARVAAKSELTSIAKRWGVDLRIPSVDAGRDGAVFVPAIPSPPAPPATDDNDVVVLVPVADFDAFVAALSPTNRGGDVTTVRPPAADHGRPGDRFVYIARRGAYAALAAREGLVAGRHDGFRAASPADQAVLESARSCLYLNVRGFTAFAFANAAGGPPVPNPEPTLVDEDVVEDAFRALHAFDAALTPNLNEAVTRERLGLMLVARRSWSAANEQLVRGIVAAPRSADLHVELASAYVEEKQTAAAAKEFGRAVSIDPKNFDAVHGAGSFLYQMGDLKHAVPLLRQAVLIRPWSPVARNDLGVALSAAGDPGSAVAQLRVAVSLDRGYRVAQNNLLLAERRAATRPTGDATRPQPPLHR